MSKLQTAKGRRSYWPQGGAGGAKRKAGLWPAKHAKGREKGSRWKGEEERCGGEAEALRRWRNGDVEFAAFGGGAGGGGVAHVVAGAGLGAVEDRGGGGGVWACAGVGGRGDWVRGVVDERKDRSFGGVRGGGAVVAAGDECAADRGASEEGVGRDGGAGWGGGVFVGGVVVRKGGESGGGGLENGEWVGGGFLSGGGTGGGAVRVGGAWRRVGWRGSEAIAGVEWVDGAEGVCGGGGLVSAGAGASLAGAARRCAGGDHLGESECGGVGRRCDAAGAARAIGGRADCVERGVCGERSGGARGGGAVCAGGFDSWIRVGARG